MPPCRHSAKGGAQIGLHDGGREPVQVDQVAHVKRELDDRHGRHRDLQQCLAGAQLPAVRRYGPQAIGEGAEQLVALAPLLGGQPSRRQEVRSRERPEIGRQGGRVVQVPPFGQDLQKHRAPAETRPTKPEGALASRGLDRVLGGRKLRHELVARVPLQPAFVVEGVIPDLVAPVGDHSNPREAVGAGGVHPDDEEGDPTPHAVQQVEERGHERRQVRPPLFPARIPVGALVRPEVVEIERNARDGPAHAAPAAAGDTDRDPCSSDPSSRALRSANASVSLTFRVPFAIWAEFAMKTRSTVVRDAGSSVAE